MWTREILDYIEQNKWKDEMVLERLKCFFTTWTHEYMIGKNQDECESLLKRLYENAEVVGCNRGSRVSRHPFRNLDRQQSLQLYSILIYCCQGKIH